MKTAQNHLPLARQVRQRMEGDSLAAPAGLSTYGQVQGWVLIADPGAGKTDVFKSLAHDERGHYITARNFIELDLPDEWTAPLFIDGLDEASSGQGAGQTALGQIRSKLQALGTPRFRIACREADWRGSTDAKALEYLVGESNFLELHLLALERSQSAALIAHWQSSSAEAADKFIRAAEDHDLDGLLDNPQTLRMLAEAMAARPDGWPASKRDVYELACEQLALEFNDDHLAKQRKRLLFGSALLEAAGYLSAVMLLSSSAAITLQNRTTSPQNSTLALTDLPAETAAPALAICQAVLERRLFRGEGSGEFLPVHRTVAEFLGARYLIARIHAGLPARRVLALMLGRDAGVVPEMRGLHAWLAALAPDNLRRELIAHDPLGIVLYGDVRHFSRAEKLQVIEALRTEAESYVYFRNQNWASKPFGALATRDMADDFKALLMSIDRSPAHLALVDCLLDALTYGEYLPELIDGLDAIVRDKTHWPGYRRSTIGILSTYADRSDDWLKLLRLLNDVHDGVVEDADDELLGSLLRALYPKQVLPTKVWQYFKQPKSDRLIGAYWSFWNKLSSDLSPTDVIPTLLDTLRESGFKLKNEHDRLGSAEIVGALLVRGVTEYGSQIDTARLYSWLSLGLGPHQHCPLSKPHKNALGEWLTAHPAIFKALFEFALNGRPTETAPATSKLWRIGALLYGADEPAGSWSWYLTLAQATADDESRRTLLLKAFWAAEKEFGINRALELLHDWPKSNPQDSSWVTDFLFRPYPLPEAEQLFIDSDLRSKTRDAEESRQRAQFFRDTLPDLATDACHLGALVEVGNAYLNFYHRGKGETAELRLLDLFDQDEDSLQMAQAGLRYCLRRPDLPTAASIIDLNIENRRYNLATPCLAAIDLRYTEQPGSAFDLPQATLETLVAFRLTNNFNGTPLWFKQLVKDRPDVFANVLQHLIGKQITAKKEHVDGLYPLAHDADYAPVARQITPQLITAFPVKASKMQLQSLRLLIVAMLNQLDAATQLNIVAEKLELDKLDVAQRVYWLTAGVKLMPQLYFAPAKAFIEKTQARTSHAFALIHERQDSHDFRFDFSAAAQAFFVGLLAPANNPRWHQSSGIVTPEMEMGRYVDGLLSALAGNPDKEAAQALLALQQRKDMAHWKEQIERALYKQRLTQRTAFFKPASVNDVAETLANRKPANAADLWALTVDFVTQLRDEIRHGSTNDYGQYWRDAEPKIEDDCRNALLSDLKKHLQPLGIAAEAEGRYADEKRADIKIISPPWHIPIEIKRETHRDVWTAINGQLVAKYSRETSSDGYGIYLVFWFTGKFSTAPTDGGTKPKNPQELEQRLKATVSEALRNKIAILVIDCSKPQLS
jgi:hypothetical protein